MSPMKKPHTFLHWRKQAMQEVYSSCAHWGIYSRGDLSCYGSSGLQLRYGMASPLDS